jgi:Relaxase/Mobilisation nuclease domain
VARAPEVLVKVSGGAKSLRGASAHLRYIDRQGGLEIETDQGERLNGEGADQQLLADWDLDFLDAEARSPYRGTPGRRPAKILHNVVLSMPTGTSAEKLLAASKAFAREEFALKHRYAMVLHTDQDHPHVHLVIKAMSEDGERLNIRKATLREWRREFARQLRAQGVAANATERAVRGEIRKSLRDGIYRAARRSESRHVRRHVEHVITQLKNGGFEAESGKAKLLATREAVVRGWQAVADSAAVSGQGQLAEKIWKFIGSMPPPTTDRERMASLMLRERGQSQERKLERTR